MQPMKNRSRSKRSGVSKIKEHNAENLKANAIVGIKG